MSSLAIVTLPAQSPGPVVHIRPASTLHATVVCNMICAILREDIRAGLWFSCENCTKGYYDEYDDRGWRHDKRLQSWQSSLMPVPNVGVPCRSFARLFIWLRYLATHSCHLDDPHVKIFAARLTLEKLCSWSLYSSAGLVSGHRSCLLKFPN